jgi:hypothetical protein
MITLDAPKTFSNLQKELLKLYAANVGEDDLLAIRLMISKYFANKASSAVDDYLKDNQISTQEYNSWQNEHNRSKGSN